MIKSGTFDKNKPQNTGSVSPTEWLAHFKNLLGKVPVKSDEEMVWADYVKQNKNNVISELDNNFTEKIF